MRARLAALALFMAGMSCCSIPSMRPDIEDFADLCEGCVVVVGRARLDPPLGKDEATIQKGIGTEKLKSTVFLLTGFEPYSKRGEPSNDDLNDAIEVGWGKLFFSEFDPEPHYLHMGMFWLDLHTVMSGPQGRASYSVDSRAYMPANLKLDIRKGDQVVYIGTIKFKRDDFNAPQGLTIIDDSEKDYAKIKERFGNRVRIRKALPTRAK